MNRQVAIQCNKNGNFRFVGIETSIDDEGNEVACIKACFNQGEVEWYSELSYPIEDLKDYVVTPAPWTSETTVHYNILGQSQIIDGMEIAYFTKVKFTDPNANISC